MFLSNLLKRSPQFLPKASKLCFNPQYNIILHEYQVMDLLQKYDLPVINGSVATNAEQALNVAQQLKNSKPTNQNQGISFTDFVVKAQIHAGGRGKGFFKENGMQSGVQFATSPQEVKDIAEKMLGKTLITKQTGLRGRSVNSVLVVERTFLRKELYLAITLDRKQGGIVIICNERGGVNIEQQDESSVKTHFVNVHEGLTQQTLDDISKSLNLGPQYNDQLHKIVKGLYKCFSETDSTLLEINPLGLTIDGKLLICDQKMNVDDNAAYRQPEIAQMEDITQKDSKEIEADQNALNYIALDGNIGCMVNGAGLAMATMDLIQSKNGMPANFLDCGGKADDRQVFAALKIMEQDPNVEAIFVNIFAGITRCDIICLGLIRALSELGMKKPIVLRLKGTNVDEAKQIIQDSGFNMLVTEDLSEAAEKAVKMAAILRMARDARINILLTS
ncbi:hypothetical protein ABPG74_011237 [Tetrahymena malaccensis]